jgi:MFS family permease
MAQNTLDAEQLTPVQKKAFLAAWLGWGFDGLDSFIYGLVAIPFVKELLPAGASNVEVTTKAALIQAVFLIGWALGGAVFGRVGDRLGRSRTLMLTILIYACFTGLSFVATEWWHLLIFRFIAALGIGGEWAAGSALVSETLPPRFKHLSGAVLQSAYVSGMILAAYTTGWFAGKDPRYVFLVGVLPAVITLWIRRAVPEPEEWKGEREAKEMPRAIELFRPPVLSTTLFTIALTATALTTVWSVLFFAAQVIRAVPEVAAMPAASQSRVVMHVTIVYSLWNIVGNFFAAWLARRVDYRKAFVILFFGAMAAYLGGFAVRHDLMTTEIALCVAMFFSSGIFALFPPYIPPLFPVLLRTAGSGFCYNIGRVTAAAGTLFGGAMAASAGGPHLAIFYSGMLYVIGGAAAFFVPLHKMTGAGSGGDTPCPA